MSGDEQDSKARSQGDEGAERTGLNCRRGEVQDDREGQRAEDHPHREEPRDEVRDRPQTGNDGGHPPGSGGKPEHGPRVGHADRSGNADGTTG